MDGNFDRVMGFCGAVIGIMENYNQYKKVLEETSTEMKKDEFAFLHNNKAFTYNYEPLTIEEALSRL